MWPGLARHSVVAVTIRTTDAGGLSTSKDVEVTVVEDSPDLAPLGIAAAGLVVVAGFVSALYARVSLPARSPST